MTSNSISRTYRFGSCFIRSHAPRAPGVYSILRRMSDKTEVEIYVGEASDICHILLDHCLSRLGQSLCIWQNFPTHFTYEVVWSGENARRTREIRWIKELDPICNRTHQKKRGKIDGP